MIAGGFNGRFGYTSSFEFYSPGDHSVTIHPNITVYVMNHSLHSLDDDRILVMIKSSAAILSRRSTCATPALVHEWFTIPINQHKQSCVGYMVDLSRFNKSCTWHRHLTAPFDVGTSIPLHYIIVHALPSFHHCLLSLFLPR
jgi:hypothetical protein